MSVINPTPSELATSHFIRKCFMKGCLEMGWWSPVIVFSPDGVNAAYRSFDVWLMCDWHKEQIGIDDLLIGSTTGGLSGWEQVVSSFVRAGIPPPERQYTKLIWQPA